MTEVNVDVDSPMGQVSATSCPAAFARPAPGDPWTATRFADVRAILADRRFEVPQAEPCDAVGTIAWLRASVSRFVNGAEHERRRAQAVGELARLSPELLRSEAKERSHVVLAGLGRRGDRVELMGPLARRVPMATLAAALHCPDPESAATAVIAAAAGYLFALEDPERLRVADAATTTLVDLFMPSEIGAAIARISLLAQGCDATAGLVGTTLEVLQDATLAATVETTDALLAEVLRHSPTLLLSRRVAGSDLDFDRCHVSAGDTVLCHIDTANRDSAAFERPDQFDPSRKGPLNLTFGYGVRPCPAAPHALALAAGVIDAVREACGFLPGRGVDYEPSGLRIPQRIEAVLR